MAPPECAVAGAAAADLQRDQRGEQLGVPQGLVILRDKSVFGVEVGRALGELRAQILKYGVQI
jgi:hypothetical protein